MTSGFRDVNEAGAASRGPGRRGSWPDGRVSVRVRHTREEDGAKRARSGGCEDFGGNVGWASGEMWAVMSGARRKGVAEWTIDRSEGLP